MKPETRMWNNLRPVILHLDPVRIESTRTASGIPDVNYVHGWIELKCIKNWPVREGLVKIEHFTKEQRNWLISRRTCGGKAFLLLKVGKNEWLLFDGLKAALAIGKATREELYSICVARWTKLPEKQEITRWLLS